MHGLIFTGFRAFVASEYSQISDRVWEDEPRYLATAAYDDGAFTAVLGRAIELSGETRQTVLRRFGIFSGISTFRLLYPDYYASHDDTISFLLDIEDRIHEVVRRTVPGSAPPHLDIVSLNDGGVSIAYTSRRQLCELLEGLVIGVSRYYGDAVRIDQPLCMHRGDVAGCTFFVSRA